MSPTIGTIKFKLNKIIYFSSNKLFFLIQYSKCLIWFISLNSAHSTHYICDLKLSPQIDFIGSIRLKFEKIQKTTRKLQKNE